MDWNYQKGLFCGFQRVISVDLASIIRQDIADVPAENTVEDILRSLMNIEGTNCPSL